MLDIVRLRTLAAIAAHGSITKPPGSCSGSEGEQLARRATEIVGRVAAAAEELSAMAGLRTGRVAGFQSALATLRREHPGIERDLTEAHPRVALDLLRAGRSTPPAWA